jgi:hypothetical protein
MGAPDGAEVQREVARASRPPRTASSGARTSASALDDVAVAEWVSLRGGSAWDEDQPLEQSMKVSLVTDPQARLISMTTGVLMAPRPPAWPSLDVVGGEARP